MLERDAEVVTEGPSSAEPVVQALIAEHCHASCDLAPIDQGTWAIRGSIAYDGEVILAEFDSREQAQRALQQFATPDNGPIDC